MSVIVVLISIMHGGNASADAAKTQICALGVSLGEIASREFFFGREFSTGQPPPDQVAAIAASTSNAIANAAAAIQRENRVSILADRYRQSLEWTYDPSRPDNFQYQANCDSLLFSACYEFGYAETGGPVMRSGSER